MDEVFEQFSLQLVDKGVIDLQHIFVDGIKIEANANKYSFVWGKAVNNFDKQLKGKIATLLDEGKAVVAEGMATMTLQEQLEQTADSLQEEVVKLEQSIENERKKLEKHNSRKNSASCCLFL